MRSAARELESWSPGLASRASLQVAHREATSAPAVPLSLPQIRLPIGAPCGKWTHDRITMYIATRYHVPEALEVVGRSCKRIAAAHDDVLALVAPIPTPRNTYRLNRWSESRPKGRRQLLPAWWSNVADAVQRRSHEVSSDKAASNPSELSGCSLCYPPSP